MNTVPHISIASAQSLPPAEVTFIDVRDPSSLASAHIPGAQHINDHNIADFVANADKHKQVIVYCYHGYSSVGGAGYLIEQGFQDVSSLEGGFTAWSQAQGPTASA